MLAHPVQPLMDFMGMLKMWQSSEDSNGSEKVKEGGGHGSGTGAGAGVKKSNGEREREMVGGKFSEDMEMESGSRKVQETLINKIIVQYLRPLT